MYCLIVQHFIGLLIMQLQHRKSQLLELPLSQAPAPMQQQVNTWLGEGPAFSRWMAQCELLKCDHSLAILDSRTSDRLKLFSGYRAFFCKRDGWSRNARVPPLMGIHPQVGQSPEVESCRPGFWSLTLPSLQTLEKRKSWFRCLSDS